MKACIKWVDEVMFVGETGSGHAVVLDGPPDAGGRNMGARPMEMLLLGLGGCTAFDVISILKKGRHAVDDCRVELNAERADSIPKIFTKIHVHFIITGQGLADGAVKRAVDLSAEKYCSASIMLGKAAEISHSFEVVETGEV